MSSSLTATLERVNALRKQAIHNPTFEKTAKEHTEAIEREQVHAAQSSKPNKQQYQKAKVTPFSTLYANLDNKPAIY